MAALPSERGETDPGLRRRQHYLLGGRLLVATLLLGGSLLLRGDDQFGAFTQDALMALIAATFAVSLLVAVALPRVRRPELVAGLQLAWDLVLVTGITYLLGGAASGFSFLYGVVILAAALVVGPRATQITTAVALLAFAVVGLALANGWLPPPPDQPELGYTLEADELALALLRNLVGFVLVGLLAGSLSDRLRRTGGQLARAEESAAGYARLNEDILRSMASGLLTTDLERRIQVINPAGAEMLGGPAERLIGRELASVLPRRRRRGARGARRGRGRAPGRDALPRRLQLLAALRRERQPPRTARGVPGSHRAQHPAREGRAGRAPRRPRTPRGRPRPRDPKPAGLDLRLGGDGARGAGAERGGPAAARARARRGGSPERPRHHDARHRPAARARARSRGSRRARGGGRQGGAGGRRPTGARPGSRRSRARDGGPRADPAGALEPREERAPALAPGGEVRVDVGWDDAARPTFSVSDDGPGVAPEDRERLFEMFFSRRRHGIGLGLALVRQIVDAHRGEITVESEPGHGATFAVHLPSDLRPSAISRPSAA
ncbi:MAG: ATP-binding protein [Sandaracinaceae bacterium]|nr:ATP-binding protein [Sandaracinaceae bacterium]